jgi:hypothetical protein
MNDALTIEFNRADVDAFTAQTNRLITALGKTPEKAVRYAGVALATSLGASTKVVKDKLRPIVANPDRRGEDRLERDESGVWVQRKADRRRAKWGMWVYRGGNGAQVFVGIRRRGGTAKFSRTRLFTTWEDVSYVDTKEQAEAEVKRRTIGRRGLAKDSWKWMINQMGRHLRTSQKVIPGSVSVKLWKTRGEHTLYMVNGIRYIRSALKGGSSDISLAMGKAATNLKRAVERSLGFDYKTMTTADYERIVGNR